MWLLRDRIAAFPALMTLIAVLGGSSMLTVAVLDHYNLIESLGYRATSARSLYILLAIMIPSLMLMLYQAERRSRKIHGQSGTP